MATQYRLSYLTRERRWKKYYRGKQYYFPLLEGETKETSYHRVLDEWERKKTRLDLDDYTRSPAYSYWHQMLEEALPYLDHAKQSGNRIAYQQAHEFVTIAQVSMDQKRPLPSEMDDAARQRYMEHDAALQGPAPWDAPQPDPDKTVGGAVKRFLDIREQMYKSKQKSAARYDGIVRGVRFFSAWLHDSYPVAEINEDKLEEYHAHLIKHGQANNWSPYTFRDYWGLAKQFLRWCWKTKRLQEWPRNIDDQDLSFSVPIPEILTFSIDEIKQFLARATPRMKLYLLLQLNTGMQQQDISDMNPKEVDWEAGFVERRRSKTKEHENVPKVRYPLWPETFRLLKEFRSNDPDHVLLTERRNPLRTTLTKAGDITRNDAIHCAWERLMKVLKIEHPKAMKLLRKTSSTMLAHQYDESLAGYFLGHAPRGVAQRHYLAPSEEKFTEAVKWLGEQLGVYELQPV